MKILHHCKNPIAPSNSRRLRKNKRRNCVHRALLPTGFILMLWTGILFQIITFGAPVLEKFKCGRPLDVHLMIENPGKFSEDFAKAIQSAHGKKKTTVQLLFIRKLAAVCTAFWNILKTRRLAGVSINPATPLRTIEPILRRTGYGFTTTVNPGFRRTGIHHGSFTEN